jgi:protein TonB
MLVVALHKVTPKSEVVEIDYLSTPPESKVHEIDPKKLQIVEQDQNRVNDEKDEKAKYLSRFDQKVLQETKAQLNGKYTNSAGQMSNSNIPQPEVKKVVKKKTQPEKVASENGFKRSPTIEDLKPKFDFSPKLEEQSPTVAGLPGAPSQNNDHLKDVQPGVQTLLSTREFVYYSYYSRIKNQLRFHWEPRIKDKFMQMMRQGRTIASSKTRITKVVITLNSAGTLIKVQVLDESGIRDLDDAAVEAFKAAAPFPNPPKGIVESDGTIKIRWDFVLEA